MEKKGQGMCPTHGTKFQSFRCYTCNQYLCPDCLKAHPHRDKLVRTEIIGHFLTYNDSGGFSSGTKTVHIWTYNVATKSLNIKDLNGARFEQSPILIQYVVYLTGGLDRMSNGYVATAYNDVFSYDIRTAGNFVMKAPMLSPICFNALCTVTEAEFFSIGGKDPSGYLNFCDKYVINADKWVRLKPISVPRGNVSLCVFNCRTIYCIGGHCASFNDTFESLDTTSEGNKWAVINLAKREKFDPRIGMMVVQDPIKDNIMIFGGCSQLGITKDIFEYKLHEQMVIRQLMALKKAAVFVKRQAILWNDVYYLFEYGRRAGIYTYSLKDNKVERIKPKTYLGDANFKKIK